MLGWSELRTQSYQLLSAHENRTQKIKMKKGKKSKKLMEMWEFQLTRQVTSQRVPQLTWQSESVSRLAINLGPTCLVTFVGYA